MRGSFDANTPRPRHPHPVSRTIIWRSQFFHVKTSIHARFCCCQVANFTRLALSPVRHLVVTAGPSLSSVIQSTESVRRHFVQSRSEVRIIALCVQYSASGATRLSTMRPPKTGDRSQCQSNQPQVSSSDVQLPPCCHFLNIPEMFHPDYDLFRLISYQFHKRSPLSESHTSDFHPALESASSAEQEKEHNHNTSKPGKHYSLSVL